MFNAYAQVTAALDRAVTGLPAGRSKAVYAKNCHAIVPCTDEAYANDIAARCREAMGCTAEITGKSIAVSLDANTLASLLRKAMADAEQSEREPDGDTDEGYAELKLMTLARKGDRGLCDTDGIKRAAWLLMGVTAYPQDAKRTAARIKEAALAVREMLKDIPTKERESIRRECGLIGMAGSALMSAGRKIIGL